MKALEVRIDSLRVAVEGISKDRLGKRKVYPETVREQVLALMSEIDLGEIEKRIGIPLRTLRMWRQSKVQKNFDRIEIKTKVKEASPIRFQLDEGIWLEIDPKVVTRRLLAITSENFL